MGVDGRAHPLNAVLLDVFAPFFKLFDVAPVRFAHSSILSTVATRESSKAPNANAQGAPIAMSKIHMSMLPTFRLLDPELEPFDLIPHFNHARVIILVRLVLLIFERDVLAH